jgi:integrase
MPDSADDRRRCIATTPRRQLLRATGLHAEWVFPFRDRAIQKMNDSGWKNARQKAALQWQKDKGEPAPDGYGRLRVHDLKHTFGRRLRAAGVTFEDRQVLLGHKSQSVTTHYSAPDVANLVAAANRVAATEGHKVDTMTILRRKSG